MLSNSICLFFWAWFLKLSFEEFEEKRVLIFALSHLKLTDTLSRVKKVFTWEG